MRTFNTFVPGHGGSALVGVLALVTAILLVGSALFIMGSSEGDVVEYVVDDARAFYVAEGGLERARGWLGDLLVEEPTSNPVGMVFENQALGGGIYSVEVVDEVSGVSWLPAYEVVSTGVLDGVVRQVRSIMVAETFARYQWFCERGGWTWFGTGERFEGPVHMNQAIQIDGDPWFGGRVTSAGNVITIKEGSYPTFEMGYQLNVADIDLPDMSYLETTIKDAALNGGLYLGPIGGKDAYYHVVLNEDELIYQKVKMKKNGKLESLGAPQPRPPGG